MAEFDRGPKDLFHPQLEKIEWILRFYKIPSAAPFDPSTGTFPMERDWERGLSIDTGFPDRLTLFYRWLMGEDPTACHLELDRVRRLQVRTQEGKRSETIPPSYLRVVNTSYTGNFKVGESGWVLLNVKDQDGKSIMSEEIYEEVLTKRDSSRFKQNSNFGALLNNAPCIMVHPDYIGFEKVLVVAFDPLVDTIFSLRSMLPTPLDALVFDEEGKLVPKMVNRVGYRIGYARF